MQKRSAIDRFTEKYEANRTTGCWEWIASFGGAGYGQFGETHSDLMGAHVFSYKTFVGQIPEGHDVHHKCRNKACVRPDHLEAIPKKVHASLHSPKETHCRNGHEYKEGSYYNRSDGAKTWRQCKLCCRNQYKKNYPRYKFGPIHLAASTG